MSRTIAIIGSRETPEDQLKKLEQIAEFFAKRGWTLRTGGSWGADQAAFNGFSKVNGKIELYLPYQGFNEHKGILWSQENWDEAAKQHPYWETMSLNGKLFHSRNVSIALGLDNKSPADCIVAWTEGGEEVGGSMMVLKLGRLNKIPLFNLGSKTGLTKLRKFCKKL